ncbi:MAG TPA: HIT family protein [Acidimicrobiales bacterium]|nr:HIT family protein [Acidimicrobiales bacterium]
MRAPGCVFCEVVEGRTAAVVVSSTEHTLAFLDRSPVFFGHTLVVPREHHETLIDLPGELLLPFFAEVQRLSGAAERGLGAAGSFVAMNNRVSQSVPHLHAHVVPRNRKDGLRGFFWPRLRYRDASHMAEVADALRGALSPS